MKATTIMQCPHGLRLSDQQRAMLMRPQGTYGAAESRMERRLIACGLLVYDVNAIPPRARTTALGHLALAAQLPRADPGPLPPEAPTAKAVRLLRVCTVCHGLGLDLPRLAMSTAHTHAACLVWQQGWAGLRSILATDLGKATTHDLSRLGLATEAGGDAWRAFHDEVRHA